MAKSATERKAAQRARLSSTGGIRHELVLTQQEAEMLDSNRQRRNPGHMPYSRNEYISLLIICDSERLARQEVALGTCQRCGNQLPVGCQGDNKGEAVCFYSRHYKLLNLTCVTGHANLKGE
ncbi:hypothetical protein [Obesumbacterium proteus]|uniref:hypothetical protein n=1 Tax=Obesumbacterium proteus TaxID=82983 RepID=UPI00242FDA7A|nr:hypothetical protein [Obesumbacterium proteus]